jgi:hypothetical protein
VKPSDGASRAGRRMNVCPQPGWMRHQIGSVVEESDLR